MYNAVFQIIADYLADKDAGLTKSAAAPFRKRSEHIWRVYRWASRLMEDINPSVIDKDAVLTAALFHDVGYAVSVKGKDHAEKSASFFEEYAVQQGGYDDERLKYISFLIRSHSNKALMSEEGTPLDLIILMEADLLDETGALSILWDCMVEGAQKEQSFHKAFDHIKSYSGKILDSNPMYTEKAKELWRKKQALVKEFIEQLSYDLGE